MKKVILCAALALTSVASFATIPSITVNKSVTINANEFLTLTPNTSANVTLTWNNPTDYETQAVVGVGNFTLTANHDFTVTIAATDFVRNLTLSGYPATGLVPTSVEPETLMKFRTAHIADEVCTTYYGTPLAPLPVTNTAQNAVYNNTGTASTQYELFLYIQGNLNNNMSGVYESTVSMIASLN